MVYLELAIKIKLYSLYGVIYSRFKVNKKRMVFTKFTKGVPMMVALQQRLRVYKRNS